jgi:oligopeptide transport system substrate-binding protein
MTTTSRLHWWLSLALLLVGGCLAVVFLGPEKSLAIQRRAAADENVLRVVYTQLLQPDPHVRLFPMSSYNLFVLSLWEPLVECDPATGEPRPAAATGWSWSPDYRTLTVQLRADARWSNGDPVRAADFVRAWRRLLRKRIDLAYGLFPVKNAEAFHRGKMDKPESVGLRALGDFTLQVELEQPRTSFVAELADPLLAPLHESTEKVLTEQQVYRQPDSLVTNGPFRLIAINADGYRLERNPFYHDRGQVRLAGVKFIRTTYAATGALLVASGGADVVPSMSYVPERVRPTDRPVVVESELTLGVVANYFNVTRGPLRDVRVRQALALALDRENLIEEADRSRLVPAWSWVPDMPGRKGLGLFEENTIKARRLLAEAGYADGKGLPVFRMSLPAWMEGDAYAAASAERWYRELGVRTYVAYEPLTVRSKRLADGDYDITYGSVVATVPDAADLLSSFTMPGEYSETKWHDDETSSLLAEANHKTGAGRLALLEQAERRAMAAVPAVPLMFERRNMLHSADVQGWYTDPLARQSPKRLWLEAAPVPLTEGQLPGT